MDKKETRKRLQEFSEGIKAFVFRGETISTVLVVLFFIAALSSIFLSPQLYQRNIHEGDIALKNMYAPYDFTYSWGVNEEETARVRETASKEAPYVLEHGINAEETDRAGLDKFFAMVMMKRAEEVPLADKINALKGELGDRAAGVDIKFFVESPDLPDLHSKALNVLNSVLYIGYIDEQDLSRIKEAGAKEVVILDEKKGETERTVDKLISKDKIKSVVGDYALKQFKNDKATFQAVTGVVMSYLTPNLKINDKRTGEKREELVKKVLPVLQSWTVEKNELIVEKGKRVDARNIAQISYLRRFFRPGVAPTFFLGILLLFLLASLAAAINISFTQKAAFFGNTKNIAIMLINMLLVIVLADFIMRSPQPSYFISLAAAGMILTLLVNFNIAFLIVVLMSMVISILVGGGIELALVLFTGSVVAIYAVRDARRRSQILWAGLLAGVAKFVAITCIGLINSMDMDFYIRDGMWGVASGLFSGFLVMGLLPLFENIFKVPTNISLLELSDLNHPLLKRLAMEAPGTYHHSIMVGNMAEAACDAIGANSLLARVGAYYHDIGKITKAEYFSENEMYSGSRHTKLAPSMSALIISKHVKDGVDLAKKHKLNNAIIDFIAQHHGDSLILYFYQKAVEKAEDSGEVLKEENFRYSGPKPQTKESAIVLLADAVEAASRTLDEPTPASIRHLVKKIINNKFIDEQLDECDLTLKDIHEIADSFTRVLMGVFHTRLDYPEEAKKSSNGALADDSKNKQRKPKQKKKD